MKEIVTTPGNRLVLYLGAMSLVTALCLAGIVYDAEPEQSVEDLETNVWIYTAAGDTEQAEASLDTLLYRDPENLYGNLMRAYNHNAAEEPEKAYLAYRRSLRRIGECPELEDDLLQDLSLLALKTERYEEAMTYAEQRIEAFGENFLSRYIIALSSFCLEDDRAYEENMNRAVEMGILDPAITTRLNALLNDMGKLEQLYIQSLLDRARFEQRFSDLEWIGRESSRRGSD